ncbi:MAG: methyl-accepting chemotaxis protein [Spirochaetota bacterium]|nr:methyl-accepting chemotaxis protein [Spirochaetota bacterium]
MSDVQKIIEGISTIVNEITETARYVNSDSHKRKSITSNSLSLIEKLIEESGTLKTKFGEILQYLKSSYNGIDSNSGEFKSNVEHFSDILLNLDNIKKTLNTLESEIDNLNNIIEEIKNDTEEIFLLAINASVESSKYSHNAKVFDVLANKLNEMSNFINQNLISIVDVVDPIIDGIGKLINENSIILNDITEGHKNFIEFTDILDKQKNAVNELMLKVNTSAEKINDQKMMLEDINEKVGQMDTDAIGAITGSGNVIKAGEDLQLKTQEVISAYNASKDYMEIIDHIHSQSSSIWQTAEGVNTKSKSQLEFSLSCVAFCDSIISESAELQKTTTIVKEQSVNNNNTSNYMSQALGKLISQLNEIEKKIVYSNNAIQKFIEDYEQINSIVNFLKSILKSMKVIGMYSRIESSRDPNEFEGFMTIYENINRLQNHIQKNVPKIEENINSTQVIIEKINLFLQSISSVFYAISNNSNSIIVNLKEITNLSAETESVGQSIVEKSIEIDTLLNELRGFLLELTEVVKKPIEGSAANITRGKTIESKCIEVKELITQDEIADDVVYENQLQASC